jgi:hypothetical protein
MLRTRAAIAPVSRYLRHRHQLAKVEARSRYTYQFTLFILCSDESTKIDQINEPFHCWCLCLSACIL